MEEITILQEQKEHFAEVRELIIEAFKADEHSDHTEQDLVCRLRSSESFIPELSLIATIAKEDEQIVAGYTLLTKIDIISSGDKHQSLALAPVAVLPEYQGRGIGGALICRAHDVAAKLGYSSVVVLGHKDYYPRFGYKPCSDFGIVLPFDVPAEYCMVIELQKGALNGVSGTVRYDDAFMG